MPFLIFHLVSTEQRRNESSRPADSSTGSNVTLLQLGEVQQGAMCGRRGKIKCFQRLLGARKVIAPTS